MNPKQFPQYFLFLLPAFSLLLFSCSPKKKQADCPDPVDQESNNWLYIDSPYRPFVHSKKTTDPEKHSISIIIPVPAGEKIVRPPTISGKTASLRVDNISSQVDTMLHFTFEHNFQTANSDTLFIKVYSDENNPPTLAGSQIILAADADEPANEPYFLPHANLQISDTAGFIYQLRTIVPVPDEPAPGTYYVNYQNDTVTHWYYGFDSGQAVYYHTPSQQMIDLPDMPQPDDRIVVFAIKKGNGSKGKVKLRYKNAGELLIGSGNKLN